MVVARCWQQWITEGRVYRRGGSGRPRNTNDREDRAIRRVATSAPTTSLASIQRHLPPSRHPVPSRETIRRRLTEVSLRSRRPLRRLPLTPHHRQCRLDFCRPRATWSVTDWRRVIFSDESRFSLSADDHRTRVWRRTGQRSDPAFIVERHTAISQGVTVWGAISWDTRSSLGVLQGTLTARRYVDDILTPIVLPMLSSRPGAIYQQDNVRPHTARLSQQCLQGYDVLPWPASDRFDHGGSSYSEAKSLLLFSVIADYIEVDLVSFLEILGCVLVVDIFKNLIGIYFESAAQVQEHKVIAERDDDKFERIEVLWCIL
ncbi:HTH_Tnp_Tc3_2 domain-containing protein [Trichonephila clavipes]|nr:HTH_Tnp_Tc3_2 domain-containing protein [Trichonephila clavipes]